MSLTTKGLLVILSLILVGCDGIGRMRSDLSGLEGTEFAIRSRNRDIRAIITDVTDKLIKTDFIWHNMVVASTYSYRGLITLSEEKKDGSYEWDVDENALEKIFPLKTGKMVHFSGQFYTMSKNSVFETQSTLTVLKESRIQLKGKDYPVFIIGLDTRYTDADGQENNISDVIYFAPELSFALKYIYSRGDREGWWTVTNINLPGEAIKGPTNMQRQRSGTVIL